MRITETQLNLLKIASNDLVEAVKDLPADEVVGIRFSSDGYVKISKGRNHLVRVTEDERWLSYTEADELPFGDEDAKDTPAFIAASEGIISDDY